MGGTFPTVRFDFGIRGLLVTLRPGPNPHIRNTNVYENRDRYSQPVGGQQAQLAQPANAAVACRTQSQ